MKINCLLNYAKLIMRRGFSKKRKSEEIRAAPEAALSWNTEFWHRVK
jgi:hypothetical protein